MRYLFVFATATLAAASGMAIFSAGDAAGQQSADKVITTQAGGARGGWAYAVQSQAVDEQSDELAKLNARDAQLGQEADSLVKQLAEASDDKRRDEIKDKLQTTLADQFDAQQKVRELEVARVEARVKKLRDVISKRNEARRSIIEKRLEQLTREADGLGWNSPTTGGPGYGTFFIPQVTNAYGPAPDLKPVPAYPAPAKR